MNILWERSTLIHVRFNRITALFLALISMGCVCALAALLICSKCGYENDPGSRFCSHCGAALVGGAEVNPSDTVNPPAGAPETAGAPILVSAALVEGELKAATDQLDKRNGWLVLFYCENAVALNTIAKTGKDVNERVLLLHGKCEAAVKSSVKECRVCDGVGSLVKQSSSMSVEGRSRNQAAVKEVCPACHGTGIVPGSAGLDALKHGYDVALKQYAIMREGARWVPVGNAWIPLSLDCKLNYRQVATLKRLTGSRCQECVGTGQTSCSKCDGAGRLKCPNHNCIGGFVTKKLDDKLGAEDRVISVRCSTCDGRGSIKCSACDGDGSLTCKICRGRGKLPICQHCDGEGLVQCSTCDGTGMQKKASCKVCGGCGSILCRSCMGCGRIRKSD